MAKIIFPAEGARIRGRIIKRREVVFIPRIAYILLLENPDSSLLMSLSEPPGRGRIDPDIWIIDTAELGKFIDAGETEGD